MTPTYLPVVTYRVAQQSFALVQEGARSAHCGPVAPMGQLKQRCGSSPLRSRWVEESNGAGSGPRCTGQRWHQCGDLYAPFRLAFPSPTQWAQSGSAGDAAKILRRDFGQASGEGVCAASSSGADRTRIRALVLHAVGS